MWYVCVFLQSHPFLLASIEYYSQPNGGKKFISFLNLLPWDISAKDALFPIPADPGSVLFHGLQRIAANYFLSNISQICCWEAFLVGTYHFVCPCHFEALPRGT